MFIESMFQSQQTFSIWHLAEHQSQDILFQSSQSSSSKSIFQFQQSGLRHLSHHQPQLLCNTSLIVLLLALQFTVLHHIIHQHVQSHQSRFALSVGVVCIHFAQRLTVGAELNDFKCEIQHNQSIGVFVVQVAEQESQGVQFKAQLSHCSFTQASFGVCITESQQTFGETVLVAVQVGDLTHQFGESQVQVTVDHSVGKLGETHHVTDQFLQML